MPLEATMPAIRAIIGSWKLCLIAMEHVPNFYWKHRIPSRSTKVKSPNIGVVKVGQQLVCNITKICSNLNTDNQHLEVEDMLGQSELKGKLWFLHISNL